MMNAGNQIYAHSSIEQILEKYKILLIFVPLINGHDYIRYYKSGEKGNLILANFHFKFLSLI